MDEEYDVIVLGTGLKECIISGMMSTSELKVLHIDRNKYYGGESASITPLDDFFEKFGHAKPGDQYGRGRDWNIDLIPKFLMANGQLVKLLIDTGVTRYLEFKVIDGSYVYKKGAKVYKVPSNDKEALSSSLMGIFEKRRFAKFLKFVLNFEREDNSTWQGLTQSNTASDVFTKFGLDDNTQAVAGHALAQYLDDQYKQRPFIDMVLKIKLYYESLSKYGGSPFLYPLYGLGELPQGFARLSAIYGGTYMLDRPDAEIVYEDGKVVGVKAAGEIAKCKMVVCDPSYAEDKCKDVEKVIRSICILKHPVKDTDSSTSTQILIPQIQVGRQNDIFINVISHKQMVAAKDFYLAIISTTVETNNPEEEIQVAYDILSPIEQKFVTISTIKEPVDNGLTSKVFITKSYDATSCFESTCTDVIEVFEKAYGKPYEAKKSEEQQEEQ